jgi:hypothetical protein
MSDKVRQLRSFQLLYEKVAPASLLRASSVLKIEQNILTLAANNGAIATKLRQMTPDLVRQLQQHGCEVTGIQVKVQVSIPPSSRPVAPSALSLEGKKQVADLAESLTDSPLKSALQRLAKNSRSRT